MAEKEASGIKDVQGLAEGVIKCTHSLTGSIGWIEIFAQRGSIPFSKIGEYVETRDSFETALSLFLEAQGYRDDEDIIKMLKRGEVKNG